VNCLLVLYSYHHNNTEKVANVIAKVFDAEIKTPKQIDLGDLENYDLIGFGAGIDSGKHYKQLLDLVDKLPEVNNKSAFIFSTAALTSDKKRGKDHSNIREKLESKGYVIVDEFQCKGFNTNSFMKYFGGMNRGRPNSKDLKNAVEFAQNMKQKLQK
jgi:flavodoxin